MSKFIIVAAICCVSLLIGLQFVDPAASVMLLAGQGPLYLALRFIMIAALLLLLFTPPSRNVYLKMIKGVLATALGVWVLVATYQEALKVLDSLSILIFSVCTGLSAVEPEPEHANKLRLRVATLRHTVRPHFQHYSLSALLSGAHKLFF